MLRSAILRETALGFALLTGVVVVAVYGLPLAFSPAQMLRRAGRVARADEAALTRIGGPDVF